MAGTVTEYGHWTKQKEVQHDSIKDGVFLTYLEYRYRYHLILFQNFGTASCDEPYE